MADAQQGSSLRHFLVSEDPLTVGSRWKRWRRALCYHVEARGITSVSRKKALLLDLAGDEVQDIFDVLTLKDEGAEDYERALATLNDYFLPKTNVPYKRSVFRRTEFKQEETVSEYVTRLRQLAKTCEFDQVDDMIRDQVIEKCRSVASRRKLLEEGSSLTLEKLLKIAATDEAVMR
ncbi:uncharacterized protein [Watersipora subatra]|uniref:uncharacterized protein n=1 Tax=Watersipora subatra TaxID=2589382 RepID=UPI00355BF4D5